MAACGAGKPELSSELALHFEEARDYERAARCLMITAENATNRFSHRDSIQILRHALELLPSSAATTQLELEAQILQRIGELYYALGEMLDSAVSYEAAADRAASAGLPTRQLEALLRLSLPIRYFDSDRGAGICEHALEVAKTLADPLLLAQTQLATAGFRLLCTSWCKEDEEVFAQAQETIRRLGWFEHPARCVTSLCTRSSGPISRRAGAGGCLDRRNHQSNRLYSRGRCKDLLSYTFGPICGGASNHSNGKRVVREKWRKSMDIYLLRSLGALYLL